MPTDLCQGVVPAGVGLTDGVVAFAGIALDGFEAAPLPLLLGYFARRRGFARLGGDSPDECFVAEEQLILYLLHRIISGQTLPNETRVRPPRGSGVGRKLR
jgi:hypothetical protein